RRGLWIGAGCTRSRNIKPVWLVLPCSADRGQFAGCIVGGRGKLVLRNAPVRNEYFVPEAADRDVIGKESDCNLLYHLFVLGIDNGNAVVAVAGDVKEFSVRTGGGTCGECDLRAVCPVKARWNGSRGSHRRIVVGNETLIARQNRSNGNPPGCARRNS